MDTCPEKYLLWFHHVPWGYEMDSGRTLWKELNYRYTTGVKSVDKMKKQWLSLEEKVDTEIFQHVTGKLNEQQENARKWKKVCTEYFQKYSDRPIPEFE